MKSRKVVIQYISLLLVIVNSVFAQSEKQKNYWVDSVLQTMSLDEKIGQLFMVRAFSRDEDLISNTILNQINLYHIGGICFFQGKIENQIRLTNLYQQNSKIPMLISMDAEWGTGMRLKNDGFSYPKQMTLGAVTDNKLIYQMGRQVGEQLKQIGVQLNFAPVVDINLNPVNPVINDRSFGSNRLNVTAKSFSYMKGMQDVGVLACAKHFPGHGDTDTDSHMDLPVLTQSRHRLDSIELFPFKVLKNLGIASIMIGHLNTIQLDSTNTPASLSYPIVGDLLRKNWAYEGLIITDALEMKGVTKYYKPGDLELQALLAGNDILLLSENINISINRIKTALDNNEFTLDDLNAKVTRILKAKFNAGLNKLSYLNENYKLTKEQLNQRVALKDKLYRNSISLVRDINYNVPIREINKKYCAIAIGNDNKNSFQNRLKSYSLIPSYQFKSLTHVPYNFTASIDNAETLILSIHGLNYNADKNYGLDKSEIDFINSLCDKKNTILVIFGSPYIIKFFPSASSILLAYEDNSMVQDICAQLLFGSDPIKGDLPIDIGYYNTIKEGIQRPSLMRLGYSVPELVSMNSDSLDKIDILANEIINDKAAPGCQIMCIKNGKVIFDKSYGYLDYDSTIAVTEDTRYDLASVTKIVATTPACMKLEDLIKLDIKKKFSDYLSYFDSTNKKDVSLLDYSLHQAKFISWIPFYKATLISPDTLNLINWKYYSKVATDSFAIKICDSLFLLSTYTDSIFKTILNSRLHEEKKFLYSDLGFYFIPQLVEKLSKQRMEDFITNEFYQPLGMSHTCYLPLNKNIDLQRIAPTEIDTYWRHQKIQGYVHDMGAAMMGGISGHAGLFSNAEDLAILAQCYLNYGSYGGREYFSSQRIRKYTDRDDEFKRRGIYFDLPEIDPKTTPYISTKASMKTFGHQGFTGTCVWIDPENELIFIFLSNRTYPNSQLNTLHRKRFRTKIQDVFYNAIIQ